MNENDDINQHKTFSANKLGSKSRSVATKECLIGKMFAYLIISNS